MQLCGGREQVKMEAKEGIRSLGTGFPGGCGLLCVGPVNGTWIVYKGSIWS